MHQQQQLNTLLASIAAAQQQQQQQQQQHASSMSSSTNALLNSLMQQQLDAAVSGSKKAHKLPKLNIKTSSQGNFGVIILTTVDGINFPTNNN